MSLFYLYSPPSQSNTLTIPGADSNTTESIAQPDIPLGSLLGLPRGASSHSGAKIVAEFLSGSLISALFYGIHITGVLGSVLRGQGWAESNFIPI